MRQVVLDTETTGLETRDDHRIIEIGCVELVNRRLTRNNFHIYLQPDREIDHGAIEVHGITNEFLADKPRFEEIVEQFVDYVRDSELVIHNAAFDVGFLDHELQRMGHKARIADLCSVVDSLEVARSMYPGQRNSLDALCKRLDVDNSGRDLHGALLDAELLADVYLMMTGGQENLFAEDSSSSSNEQYVAEIIPVQLERRPRLVTLSDEEQQAHQEYVELLDKKSGKSVWTRMAEPPEEPPLGSNE